MKICLALSASGRSILIFTSRRPGPQDRGVDEILAVGRADHDHVLQRLDAVDLGEELRARSSISMSEEMPVPRVRNSESISSKNTMTG